MTVSSADPAKLLRFVNMVSEPRRSARASAVSAVSSQTRVAQGCPTHAVLIPNLYRLTDLLDGMVENETFVTTVRRELMAADTSGRSILSAPDGRIGQALVRAGVAIVRPPIQFQDNVVLPGHPTGGYVDDPIAVATGNMLHEDTDLAFAGLAANLDVVRRYNSRLSERLGAFGYGWSSVLDVRLAAADDQIEVVLPDGAIASFVRTDEGWGTFGRRLRDFEALPDRGLRIWTDWTSSLSFDADGACTGWASGASTVSLEREDGRVVRATEAPTGRSWQVSWNEDGVVTAVTASDGRRVDYERDDLGRITRVDTTTGPFTYQWDGHLLTSVTDADGVSAFVNVYDDTGRVVQQTSPFGRETRYQYHANGMTVITDDHGLRQAMVHDDRANLTSVIDVDGAAMRIDYDEHDRAVATTDRSGRRWTYQFDDETDLLLSRTDPDGLGESWEWDELGRLVVQTSRGGATTTYEYRDRLRTPVRIVGPLGESTTVEVDDRYDAATSITDPDGVITWFEHDSDGQLTATMDARRQRRTIEYDDLGRPTRFTEANGAETEFTSDRHGRLLTSRCGPVTREFAYTPGGRVTSGAEPGGERWSARLGPHGSAVAVADALDHALTLEYDHLGNVTAYVAPDASRYEQHYDLLGRLVATTDPSGASTSYGYDSEGNLSTVTDAGGRTLGREFDPWGRVTRFVAPDGHATTYAYHPDGALATVETPDGSTWRTEVDAAGRVTAMIDPLGRQTILSYSPAGRLTAREAPDGGHERFAYDEVGALVSISDDDGNTTSIEYDAAGRPTTRRGPSGDVVERIDWDAAGRVVARERSGHRIDLERDPAGRLTRTLDATGVGSRFRYDQRGLLTEAVDPAGLATTYAYDSRGRLVGLTVPGERTSAFDYDDRGFLRSITDPAGVVTTAERDRSGLVTALSRGPSAWQRTLDDAGREIERRDPTGAVLASVGYDALGRTLAISDGDGDVVAFPRDAAGDIVDVAHATLEPRAGDEPSVPARPGGEPPVDAAGRLLGDEHGVTFRYDDAGRLAEILPPHRAPTEFQYGDDGLLRVEKGPNGTRQFSYDQAGRVAAISIDASSVTQYDYDPAGRRAAERHSDGSVVEYRWNHLDELVEVIRTHDGSVRRIRIDFDPLGRVEAVDGRPADSGRLGPYLFLGRRVLDITTHQFLSPDALIAAPGSNGGASAYTYAWQDPVNFVDPTGFRPISKAQFDEMREKEELGAFARYANKHEAVGTALAVGVVVAGGVLCATPLAPVGAAILLGAAVGAGVSYATTGKVDPWTVAAGGIAGGVVAGAAAAGAGVAAMAAVNGVVSGGSTLFDKARRGKDDLTSWDTAWDVLVAGSIGAGTSRIGAAFKPTSKGTAFIKGTAIEAPANMLEQQLTEGRIDPRVVGLKALGAGGTEVASVAWNPAADTSTLVPGRQQALLEIQPRPTWARPGTTDTAFLLGQGSAASPGTQGALFDLGPPRSPAPVRPSVQPGSTANQLSLFGDPQTSLFDD